MARPDDRTRETLTRRWLVALMLALLVLAAGCTATPINLPFVDSGVTMKDGAAAADSAAMDMGVKADGAVAVPDAGSPGDGLHGDGLSDGLGDGLGDGSTEGGVTEGGPGEGGPLDNGAVQKD